jgi:HAD superfamily hydrolase (TIGR01509 family)
MMEKSKLQPYLEFTLSNEDVVKSKPDPEIYNKAISKLGLKPEECLIVEDNDHGIKAAMASGANLLVVKTLGEVNLTNISNKISEIESKLCKY